MECSQNMTMSTTLLHKTFDQSLKIRYLIFDISSSFLDFQEDFLLKYSFLRERFDFINLSRVFVVVVKTYVMFTSSISLPIFPVISFNTWKICMNIL